MTFHDEPLVLIGQVIFLAASALVGVALVWLSVLVRKMPAALLQLRVYENHHRLTMGLQALGVGLLAGLIAVLPYVLHLEGWARALEWRVPLLAGWAVLTGLGILRLLQTFRGVAKA